MFLARAAIIRPLSDVDAKSGDVCQKFQAELRIFKKFEDDDPTEGILITIPSELIDVFHTGEDPLDSGVDVLAFQLVDEVWVTECPYN